MPINITVVRLFLIRTAAWPFIILVSYSDSATPLA